MTDQGLELVVVEEAVELIVIVLVQGQVDLALAPAPPIAGLVARARVVILVEDGSDVSGRSTGEGRSFDERQHCG